MDKQVVHKSCVDRKRQSPDGAEGSSTSEKVRSYDVCVSRNIDDVIATREHAHVDSYFSCYYCNYTAKNRESYRY